MSDMSWEHVPEARAALNAIVTDPDHGVAALSNAQTMSNLLKDYLPDAPREKSILVAAAEAGLADTLRDHVAQGMDPNTAIQLTASSFSSSTPFTPEACNWVTDEIAVALGISQPRSPGDQRGDSPLGGTPPGSAPVANEAPATQKGSGGGQGYPQTPGQGPAQGFGSPAQPNPQELPTAQGYRPGYAPPGTPGQVPVQGYPGQQAQGFRGQGYPVQQPQPYRGQQPAPYRGQQAQAFPGQPGAGYAGPPSFPQAGVPAAPGGWQPYAPSPGFGGPAKPRGSRRGVLVGGGIMLVVVIVLAVVISLTHKPTKTTPGGGGGSPTAPATTSPTTPTASPPPASGGVESLRTIMNPAGLTPVGKVCTQAFLFGLNASTVTSRIFCAKTTYTNIDVWGYQFDNHADYLAGVRHINSYTGFQQTSKICPPAAGNDAGSIGWHANANPKYIQRPGQFLECFVDRARPVLIWTMPTMNVFFISQDRGKGDTIPRIVDWWKTVNYG
jgi:hypothetical protein